MPAVPRPNTAIAPLADPVIGGLSSPSRARNTSRWRTAQWLPTTADTTLATFITCHRFTSQQHLLHQSVTHVTDVLAAVTAPAEWLLANVGVRLCSGYDLTASSHGMRHTPAEPDQFLMVTRRQALSTEQRRSKWKAT